MMFASKFRLSSVAFAAVVLVANLAGADGYIKLDKTKEQLKLKYDVAVEAQGDDHVTVDLTIEELGQLKPLGAVYLIVSGKDEPGFADLWLSVAVREVDGKKAAGAHLKREMAERAEFRLVTPRRDGMQGGTTWYYHTIPIAEHLKTGEQGLAVIKYSGSFEIVGTDIQGIKLADLAGALRKHQRQNPGTVYEVCSECKILANDKVLDAIKSSGVTLKHYWVPVSNPAGHFVKDSEFLGKGTFLVVPSSSKYGIGKIDILEHRPPRPEKKPEAPKTVKPPSESSSKTRSSRSRTERGKGGLVPGRRKS